MSLLRSLANESVLFLALISALCTALDLPEQWHNVVLATVPLLLAVVVRQVTSSPATVATVATQAAVKTAERLTADTAGLVGQVTDTGVQVAENAAEEVVGNVGGLVGGLTRTIGIGRR